MPIRQGGRWATISSNWLRAPGLDENRLATLVNAMQSEYIFGEIDACGDHIHGLPLSSEWIQCGNSRTGSPFHSLCIFEGVFVVANCSVFIATSLDGYIARADGSIDWLNEANNSVTPGEDCGYGKFMADVDALVMGRHTLEQVLTFDSWPYGPTPVVVMSHREISLPSNLQSSVSVSDEPPSVVAARLAKRGVKKIYVDGGLTIQSFLAAGLIDDITITVIPVLLGAGRSLFGPLPADVRLVHESTTAFEFGFVQNRYRVIRDA